MSLSTLCQRCGLCCDGNLFSSLPLQRSEVEAMRRLGLPVVEREDGAPSMVQRCAALNGRSCTIYAERPETCRSYRCLLVMALEEGEVTLEEACGVVDEAHARLRALKEVQPPPPRTHELWARAESYLDLHFRGRHRRT